MSILTTYIFVPIFQLLYMMSDEKKVSILLATLFFFSLKILYPLLKSQ